MIHQPRDIWTGSSAISTSTAFSRYLGRIPLDNKSYPGTADGKAPTPGRTCRLQENPVRAPSMNISNNDKRSTATFSATTRRTTTLCAVPVDCRPLTRAFFLVLQRRKNHLPPLPAQLLDRLL